jgi:rod shape-determining protein MreD
MNRHVSKTKILISLLLAIAFSVIYLPTGLQAWIPPLAAMVVFYWLIFEKTSFGVWSVWWIGLFAGALVGDPIGMTSFVLVLLSWPLLYRRRLIQFMAFSSRFALWLLIAELFFIAKTILLLLFTHVSWSPGLLKPMLSIVLLAPVIYASLKVYIDFSFLNRKVVG